jgi:uncharacterized damage-inducible protein DinB
MNVNDIQLLYEYNRWANARVLDAVAVLTREEFTKDLSNSYRSVRGTLTHIMWGEWIWLMRWKDISPKTVFDPADYPNLSSLRTQWQEIDQERRDFIYGLTDDSLERVIAYTNTKGEEWQYPLQHMIQHITNHSSYHRGQVTTLLRQLGVEPAATDLLLFFDEMAG